MPIASVHAPAYLVHNNIPIYQTYRDDWYDDPYHYHFSVRLYPENEMIETFDIRDLPGYDPHLSVEEIIRHAIDEKALPIFKLPEEEQRAYMLDETIGSITMSPEQDACFELADYLLTRLLDASSYDALCIPASQNVFQKTIFLTPQISQEHKNVGYSLSIYTGEAFWEDFRNKEPLKSIHIESFYGGPAYKAVCQAMDISYPFRAELEKHVCVSDNKTSGSLMTKIQNANERQTIHASKKPEPYRLNEPEL